MTATQSPPAITEAERQRRAKSIHSIRRSQQIEGGDISPFAQGVFEQYINGQITLADVGVQLKEHYRIHTK
jgi:hypothetical protein